MRLQWSKPLAVVVATACVTLTACSSPGRGGAGNSGSSVAATPASIASLVEQAKSEKGVVLYTNAPTAYLQPVIDAFQKECPGITVQPTNLSDNIVFSKYQAEAAQGARTADLVMASAPASWMQAVQNGVTANVTPLGLENFPAAT